MTNPHFIVNERRDALDTAAPSHATRASPSAHIPIEVWHHGYGQPRARYVHAKGKTQKTIMDR